MSEPLEPRIEIEKLKLFDGKGVELKGQTLSDLQQMSTSLVFNTRWTKRFVIIIMFFGTCFFVTVWWIIYYTLKTGAINNFIAKCVN